MRTALRVGGDREVIWVDLGTPDWRAVKVTAGGWDVVDQADVAFVRTPNMSGFPVPVRGGNIKSLQSILNVRASELVLAVAWLLQSLNPVGPYPITNVVGSSENGKTTLTRMMGQIVDPNTLGPRKARRVDDLLITARNNWVLTFDNLSAFSQEWSDTLCMLSTGIGTGGRALYTDDEEHAFRVERPVLFNGISQDLTKNPDLGSRVIRLLSPPIEGRRTEQELDAEFARLWPTMLGALVDGLVGALAGQAEIVVDEPARLMDFEKFAEAGCRAMGFKEWEFVEAYKLNRRGLMILSAEAHPVGRAVMKFLKGNREGYAGRMMDFMSSSNFTNRITSLGTSGRIVPPNSAPPSAVSQKPST